MSSKNYEKIANKIAARSIKADYGDVEFTVNVSEHFPRFMDEGDVKEARIILFKHMQQLTSLIDKKLKQALNSDKSAQIIFNKYRRK